MRGARRARLRTLAAATALAAAALLAAPGGKAGAGHSGGPYFDLAALPAPDVTGPQIFQGLQEFLDAYPYRLTGGPTEIAAGIDLRDQMADLGYEASIVSMVNSSTVHECSDCPGAALKAVVGLKKGTTRPDDWIMFVGHYDTVPQTIDGAYDNGAGTNLIRFLAREFSDVETNRSLAFVWFNGEEEGLLASQRYAQYLKDNSQQITAVLGFDMVGIAYPVANPTSRNCLCLFHGPADRAAFEPLLSHVNYDFLGFPGKGSRTSREVRLVGNNDRNSDERSFANRGYPTMRWAGMRRASDYVAYHLPDDTIETIVAEAGGQEFYEQGIENTLKSVYYTALALDNHAPEPVATASTSGLTVSVDGSGSTDADGEPAGYSWDFGDGATAEGPTAEHTYAGPGTYTVTLTVADNLWPDVTRSTTLQVAV